MANEFIIKNGFHSKGNSQVTGSLDVTEGITGSFSGDGSGITGTVTSASYAITASHALNASTPTLQQVTDQGATTTNDITISGDLTASADISLPTNASSIRFNDAELHGRTGGSYPGLSISSGDSSNARIWLRDTNAGTSPVTMSFIGLGKVTGVQTIESQGNYPLIIRGGAGPNDANDGIQLFTGDASNVYQQRFAIEADGTNVDAYFHNINGLGINDTTPTAMLDVNGNINTTSDITASGDISAATFTGDGSGITGVISASYAVTASHALNTAAFPFSGLAVITGSLIVSGSNSSINTNTGILYDSSEIPSVKYVQRGLFASNDTLSVQYNTRRLYKSDGTTISYDWENAEINDDGGTLAIDLGERKLHDRFGNEIGRFTTTGTAYLSGSLIGTSSWAENVTSASFASTASFLTGTATSASFASTASFLTGTATSASYAISASHLIGGGGGADPAININANGTTLTEVTSDSDLPTTLAANTTYLIRGNVATGKTLNVTNVGTSVIGIGRNQSHLSYTGSNELFNVHNQSFSVKSLTMKSSGSIMTAKNVTPGAAYNDGRTKVLDIKDCQVKNTNNVMEIHGFELVDLNNVLFWYITGSQGLSFQSVRHLEISSCEFYNWYDETDTGSFAPSGTKMLEIRPNTASVNTPVVNINSSILHPEQGQIGLYIDSGSETLFGTVASNTFIDVNGGTLLAGSNYDSGSMLKYDIGINQGLEDSKAYLYGYQNGTDAQSATTSYTQISIASFSTDIETRMSASLEGITYIGSKPIDVMFQINAGVAGVGGNNEQFDFALYKNTNIINGSERRIELDSGEEGNAVTFALTNIVQNDLLTVYYKSPTNDNFTLQNFSIMIKE